MSSQSLIQDQTFLFTGTLTEFTRDEAEALVESHGGKVLSGVSAKLKYLVVGAEAGSKLAKAKALGTVQVITEQDFLKMVPNGNAVRQDAPQVKPEPANPAPADKAVVNKESALKGGALGRSYSTEMLADSLINKRSEYSKLKKLLTDTSIELVDTGLLMLSGLNDPILIDALLEGVDVLNYELQPNDLFSGSKNKQPLLNYALLGVLSLVNEQCLNSFSLRSKFTELHIDLPNLSTVGKMKGIRRLVLSDTQRELKTLDGLEHLDSLNALVLKDCTYIESIDALKDLPICEFDWGNSKKLKNFAALKNKTDATGVQKLDIHRFWDLETLDGIEFFQALESVEIYDSIDIKDVRALMKLPKLKQVFGQGYARDRNRLDWNHYSMRQLNSIEGLLCHAQSTLSVDFVNWVDIPEKVYPDYKYISFTCNSMPNLDWLKNFPNLLGLEICSANLTDISGIAACPNLQGLIFNSPVLSDISAIACLSNLQALNINNCRRVESIDVLKNLKTLKLFGDSFKDVKCINSLSWLREDIATYLSTAKDISADFYIDKLSSILSLEALFSLEFFQGHIEKIFCYQTSILSFGEIAKFKKLKSVRIAESAVTDEILQELIQIESLVELRLVNCSIIDFRNKTKPNLNLIIDSSNKINIQNCTFKKLELLDSQPIGFKNCTFDELEIRSVNSMVNLNGITNLDVKSLELNELKDLTDADEIKQLMNLKHLSIRKLPLLSKIGFLASMTHLDGLFTEDCPMLEVKPKPKGLMTKSDVINYQLKIAKDLKLTDANNIITKLNQTKEAKPKSLSRKEFSNVKKLLQSRDLNLIMSGVAMVASLNDEGLCSELLEGIKYEDKSIEPNKIFSGTGPAQPYLNTAMLGILNTAAQFKPWADFISGITDISMEVLVLDYLACLKHLQTLSVVCVCHSSVKLDLPELRSFEWRSRAWSHSDIPKMTAPFAFGILEGSNKLERLIIGSLIDVSDNLDCFSNFTALRELDLAIGQNHLTTFKPLSHCKSLELLKLSFTEKDPGKIATLDGLEGAESLKEIRIYHLALRDTSALKTLKNVEHVQIISANLEHFTPCEDFSKLNTLNLSSCIKLSSFGEGKYPQNVSTIELKATDIKKFPKFENLQSVGTLTLSNTPVSDFSCVNTIKRIGSLDLGDCKEIVDFKGFEGVEEINGLSVSGCSKLLSFKGMEGVKLNDTTMRFSGCQSLQSFEDLRPVKWESVVLRTEKLPKINSSIDCDVLELEAATSLEGIASYHNLKELRLTNGSQYNPSYPLKDFSKLSEIPNLKKLIICTDKPLSLGLLAHFNHLEVLNLVGCTQLSEPEKLANAHIDKLYIAGCNLRKSDFPDTLQDKIDWQSKPYF